MATCTIGGTTFNLELDAPTLDRLAAAGFDARRARRSPTRMADLIFRSQDQFVGAFALVVQDQIPAAWTAGVFARHLAAAGPGPVLALQRAVQDYMRAGR